MNDDRKYLSKADILTVEERQIDLIGNNTKRSIEMTPWQIELYARWLKTAKMWIKKQTEKEKELLSDIGGENMLKVNTGEA